jgi:radical SAM protein with 4Fe4S-binding SPASM domain
MSSTTKACLDPWSFLMIKANGDVCLCCWTNPIGNINDAELDSIVSNINAQHLRSSLLTGNLSENCRRCTARTNTTTEKLNADVETYLNDHSHRYTVSQGELVEVSPNNERRLGSKIRSRIGKLTSSLRTGRPLRG